MTPTDRPTPRLSVIIPAYNEQESLEATVKAVLAALPEPDLSELVIVNDGSSDNTLAVAHAIAESCPASVVVVDRATNGGMGQALASGFERATGDVNTWIPGDGEYELGEVLVGLAALQNNDIVLVRRTSRGQLGRNIVSTIMYGLIRVLFRFDAHGYCGIFVITRARWSELTVRSATCSSPSRSPCALGTLAGTSRTSPLNGDHARREVEGVPTERDAAKPRRTASFPSGALAGPLALGPLRRVDRDPHTDRTDRTLCDLELEAFGEEIPHRRGPSRCRPAPTGRPSRSPVAHHC